MKLYWYRTTWADVKGQMIDYTYCVTAMSGEEADKRALKNEDYFETDSAAKDFHKLSRIRFKVETL